MIFYALLGALVFQRLHEVQMGNENLSSVWEKLVEPPNKSEMRQMFVLHSSWFLSCALEYLIIGELIAPPLFLAGILILCFCQWIRFKSMSALGKSWIHLPVAFKGQKIVNTGIYRYCNHPNYLVVAIEIALVPLMGKAYFTAAVFSLINLVFLKRRIQWEEMQLKKVRSIC